MAYKKHSTSSRELGVISRYMEETFYKYLTTDYKYSVCFMESTEHYNIFEVSEVIDDEQYYMYLAIEKGHPSLKKVFSLLRVRACAEKFVYWSFMSTIFSSELSEVILGEIGMYRNYAENEGKEIIDANEYSNELTHDDKANQDKEAVENNLSHDSSSLCPDIVSRVTEEATKYLMERYLVDVYDIVNVLYREADGTYHVYLHCDLRTILGGDEFSDYYAEVVVYHSSRTSIFRVWQDVKFYKKKA